jgi:hypothetical protein
MESIQDLIKFIQENAKAIENIHIYQDYENPSNYNVDFKIICESEEE